MDTPKMPNINQVALSGMIADTPTIIQSETAGAILKARVRNCRPFRDQNDQWHEEEWFFDLVFHGKLVQYAKERLSMGTPVFITGHLRSRSNNEVEISVRCLQVLDHNLIN